MVRAPRFIAALAAISLAAAFGLAPGHVFAMAPTHTSQPLNLTFQLPTSFTGCTVPITGSEAGVVDTTTFFDQNGNPTEIVEHTPNLTVTYYSVSGTAYSSVSPATTTFDVATGDITYDGMQGKIVIPGQGLVGTATGHVMFNTATGAVLVANGQTSLLTPFSPSVCALLEQ